MIDFTVSQSVDVRVGVIFCVGDAEGRHGPTCKLQLVFGPRIRNQGQHKASTYGNEALLGETDLCCGKSGSTAHRGHISEVPILGVPQKNVGPP